MKTIKRMAKRWWRKNRKTVTSGMLRALRTFTQTFLAVLTVTPIFDLDVSAVAAAASAGVGAVYSLVNRVLDGTRVPTIPPG